MENQLILSIHEFSGITNTAARTLGSQGKEGVKRGVAEIGKKDSVEFLNICTDKATVLQR